VFYGERTNAPTFAVFIARSAFTARNAELFFVYLQEIKGKSYVVKTSGQDQDRNQPEYTGRRLKYSTADKLCHVPGGNSRFSRKAGGSDLTCRRGKPQLVEREQRQVLFMNIIIDANVVFSAVLNVDGQISDLLLNS
jgi:hypothetical protein